MKEIRLATKIIHTLVKDRLHYPGRLIADTVTLGSRYGILLLLYSYVFTLKGGTIAATTFPIAAWSMFFYISLASLRIRDICKLIPQDVKSGNVEILLTKPISYIGYRIWWQLGLGIYSFIVVTLIGGGALWYTVGIPATMQNFTFLFTLATVMILGITLSLFIYTLVGLSAFWIEDASPIYWMVDKTIMILGGSYLPVAFFPPLMYKLSLYTPFGASQFATHTVYESWNTEWPVLIGIQLAWTIACGLLVYFIFSQAKKKVSVNGG